MICVLEMLGNSDKHSVGTDKEQQKFSFKLEKKLPDQKGFQLLD